MTRLIFTCFCMFCLTLPQQLVASAGYKYPMVKPYEVYHYKIKIQGIDQYDNQVKPSGAVHYLLDLFGQRPTFNEETGMFEVTSPQLITIDQVKNHLSVYGLVVLSMTRDADYSQPE